MLGTARGGRASEPSPALKEMSPRNRQKARSRGLTPATGHVIGSITIKALMVATIGAPA